MPYAPPWLARPPYGTPLDPSAALAQDMIAFLACNEGAGFPYNFLNIRDCTLFAGTSPTWTPRGLRSILGSGPILNVRNASYQQGNNFTVAVIFDFTAFQTSSPYISAIWSDSKTILRLGNASLPINAKINIDYVGTNVTSTVAATTGPVCVAMTLSPVVSSNVTQTGYFNGVPVVSQTRTNSAVGGGLNKLFTDGVSGRQPAGNLIAFAMWNRCLTAGELTSWSINPWQVLALPRVLWYFPSPSVLSFGGGPLLAAS